MEVVGAGDGQVGVDHAPLSTEIRAGHPGAADPTAGAARQLTDRRVRAPDDRGDVLERQIEHVVQHERKPFGRSERVEYDEQRQADRVTQQGFLLGVDACFTFGCMLQVVLDRHRPGTAGAQHVQAHPSDHSGEPSGHVTSDADLARVDELMKAIWGPDRGDGSLAREMHANPEALDVVVVEESAEGPVLCAGWLRYSTGTDFASMWGGSTLPEWRRQGLYRATVTHRARLARERGYRFVRVDTSPDSRPILVHLGLRAVAATTPYSLDSREVGV